MEVIFPFSLFLSYELRQPVYEVLEMLNWSYCQRANMWRFKLRCAFKTTQKVRIKMLFSLLQVNLPWAMSCYTGSLMQKIFVIILIHIEEGINSFCFLYSCNSTISVLIMINNYVCVYFQSCMRQCPWGWCHLAVIMFGRPRWPITRRTARPKSSPALFIF